MKKTALILGATGTAGRTLTEKLSESNDWDVIAVSRRGAISIDLLDQPKLAEALKEIPITHVFFAAYVQEPDHHNQRHISLQSARRQLKMIGRIVRWFPFLRSTIYRLFAKTSGALDSEGKNIAILENVLKTIAEKPSLQHVTLLTGVKYNGMHLTQYLHPRWKIPFHEADEPAPGPNFYFEQEAMLQQYAADHDFTWSVVRPSFIIGYARNSQNNLLTTLAVYATLLKEQDMPLICPGDAVALDCLHTITDARLLADMMIWSSGKNEAYNVVNQQAFRWRDVWKAIADYFGMQAEFRPDGFDATTFIIENVDVWLAIVRKYDLEPYALLDLAQPSFLVQTFFQDYDVVVSMEKAKQAGFNQDYTPAETFIWHFDKMKQERIIPTWA